MYSVALTPMGFPHRCPGYVWSRGQRLPGFSQMCSHWSHRCCHPWMSHRGMSGPQQQQVPVPTGSHPPNIGVSPSGGQFSCRFQSAPVLTPQGHLRRWLCGRAAVWKYICGAGMAPKSPALITANGQKELYSDLSRCHLQNDLAAQLPSDLLLACHPYLMLVPLLEGGAQHRSGCMVHTPDILPFLLPAKYAPHCRA